jgi:hypothetical protein
MAAPLCPPGTCESFDAYQLFSPQGRTALIIELEELIDAHGPDVEMGVLATARGGASFQYRRNGRGMIDVDQAGL